MFDYPLLKQEIWNFLASPVSAKEMEYELDELIAQRLVFVIGDFYSISNNLSLAQRRNNGNNKAALLLKKADWIAGILSVFPFVEGIAVSGSLSKNFADDHADIDFFIITTANRLWLARTFLHIFKKLTFLVNKQHYFCMNYFIDEAELSILEKNIYTAIEAVTILPLRGNMLFQKFYLANNWSKRILPNASANNFKCKPLQKTLFTKFLEFVLNNKMGNALDNYLMKLTAISWNSKASRNKKNSNGMLMSMHVGKHFSKPNPVNFQKRLLQRYENCKEEIFRHYDHSLQLK